MEPTERTALLSGTEQVKPRRLGRGVAVVVGVLAVAAIAALAVFSGSSARQQSDIRLGEGRAVHNIIWNSELITRFQLARNVLGLEDAPNVGSYNAILSEAWQKHYHGACVTDKMAYIRIYKGGNNNFANSLGCDVVKGPENYDPLSASINQCTFTFVREPIERFMSAYTEFEFRLHTDGLDWVKESFGEQAAKEAPVGSRKRCDLAINSLVTLKWLDKSVGKTPFDGGYTKKVYFGKHSAWEHVFPMASVLPGVPGGFDFIGKLENFDADWEALKQKCGTPDMQYKELPFGGGHPETTQDVLKTTAAMKAHLAANPKAMQALCLVYLDDYVNFDYPLPAACSEAAKRKGMA